LSADNVGSSYNASDVPGARFVHSSITLPRQRKNNARDAGFCADNHSEMK
jgi:hypothetical protein